MNFWFELVVSFFLLGGALFALIGSIGLARFPDFFTRVHAPTTGTTLGVGGTLIGSVIFFTVTKGTLSIHELLISMFLFITAPVSGHMMAKAAIHLKVKHVEGTRGEPWENKE
ncbi:Na+/H+ antiporter subunit G [Salinispirillum sp. LH 10-3-1]|uniref:Na+/H+ antiporter subunit G n=1 Tax=Salinispirillum sp. LH 10-3-1 TaxID=2952525 RepID=A0AB38YIL2_9GAMM